MLDAWMSVKEECKKNHKFNWKKCRSSNTLYKTVLYCAEHNKQLRSTATSTAEIHFHIYWIICSLFIFTLFKFLRSFSLIVHFVSCASRRWMTFVVIKCWTLKWLMKWMLVTKVFFGDSRFSMAYIFRFEFRLCAYAVQSIYVNLAKVHYTVGWLILHKTIACLASKWIYANAFIFPNFKFPDIETETASNLIKWIRTCVRLCFRIYYKMENINVEIRQISIWWLRLTNK